MRKQKFDEDTLSNLLKGFREAKELFSGDEPKKVLTVGEMTEIMKSLAPRLENCGGQFELTQNELSTLIFWLENLQAEEPLQGLFRNPEKQGVMN